MLFILHIILGITKVKCRNAAIPRSSLNFESVDTKVKLGHAAHNVLSKIVRTKRSAPSWKGTPVMISGFSVLQKVTFSAKQ
eukprot:scaffold178383_cov13-Tisochrysis_lutea.AAC.1